MQISIKSRYGLRAMVYLAKAKRICSANEISQKEKIPFNFLEKILSVLHKKGLIKCQKGVGGGYFLDKPPEKISVKEVLMALEDKEIFQIQCKRKSHFSRKKCPVKNIWKKVQKVLNSTLKEIKLADLIKT